MVEKDLAFKVTRFRVGDIISQDHFLTSLSDLNYQKVELVEEPGEYALRGGTIDLYPISYRSPVRIHFHLDLIEAIRDYSLHEGKSITTFEEVFLLPCHDSFLKKRTRFKAHSEDFDPVYELDDIRPGDYVVHIEYGIAQFLGLKTLSISGAKRKHLALEFAQEEILYLPFDQYQLLERYLGMEGKRPALTRLHTKQWERVKERARRATRDVAKELIGIEAKRNTSSGFSFPRHEKWEKEFEMSFPYSETPDQRRATDEVKQDMETDRPMDRLLCGDVGFGKTEVAVRAVHKAVLGGKQVAFLVPTTLLAEQHYLTLKKRFETESIEVELLSRYRTRAEHRKALEGLKQGKVDVMIGTHRLLSKDVVFKDLGLVIIDEEQRFGVRHKERFKGIRTSTDVLTLTATPIPRTLYMSLMGIRNMSVLETPPQVRLAVHTEVLEWEPERIRRAIQNELDRKGQIYFVHNRIESIEKVHRELKTLMPQVHFSVAHGRLKADALERVMSEFIDHKTDCLISTNIIESGIDIPNVNTILVNRADLFGLSDLYQLRGRVGRYPKVRQAYAYFLVPKDWVLTQDAEKRLQAIERFSELGSGFKIALQDLEIRGAGNLLGHEQSGYIFQVGFDLYCRMLKEAVVEEKKSAGK